MDGNQSRDAYRFAFQGMEKDDELHGSDGTGYDFGARLYDPRVGRFLSLDPMAMEFPFATPYNFAGNNPIRFIDENGEKPIFANKEQACLVVDDLNRLFRAKYQIDYDPFSVQEVKMLVDVTPWWQIFGDRQYETVTRYTIVTNPKFDWKDADKGEASYASDTFDLINDPRDYNVQVGERVEGPFKFGLRDGHGGGETINGDINISSALDRYGDKGTGPGFMRVNSNNEQRGWTFSGVFLHEGIYHRLGRTDGNDPNKMRQYFGIQRGNQHNASPDHMRAIPPDAQQNLDDAKKKTGDGS